MNINANEHPIPVIVPPVLQTDRLCIPANKVEQHRTYPLRSPGSQGMSEIIAPSPRQVIGDGRRVAGGDSPPVPFRQRQDPLPQTVGAPEIIPCSGASDFTRGNPAPIRIDQGAIPRSGSHGQRHHHLGQLQAQECDIAPSTGHENTQQCGKRKGEHRPLQPAFDDGPDIAEGLMDGFALHWSWGKTEAPMPGAPGNGNAVAYMRAIIASPKAEQESSSAPSIRRAKS